MKRTFFLITLVVLCGVVLSAPLIAAGSAQSGKGQESKTSALFFVAGG